LTESITFIDTNKTIKKSYEEFLNETREFAAVWGVVSKIDIAIVLYAAKILESQVNEVMNGSKDL